MSESEIFNEIIGRCKTIIGIFMTVKKDLKINLENSDFNLNSIGINRKID